MKIINIESLPNANGHYSQCIESNGLLYISGQLPINPMDKSIPNGIKEQTIYVLEKLQLILTAAGSSKNDVVQIRLYIDDIKNWDIVNFIYSDFFGNHKPVRTVVPTNKLHFGCLIEIEAIAEVKELK